jgi:hypothetical protein
VKLAVEKPANMSLETKVVAVVLLALAGIGLFVVWLQSEDDVQHAIVQGLAGPHPQSAPPAPAPAVAPAAAKRVVAN